MISSTVKKFILTPAVLSAAVFYTLSLPLNLFGSKPVTIKLQGEPVFFGQLKEFAPQYLGVTGALSVGTGILSAALIAWQHSSRKSAQDEEKLLKLAQNLKEKQQLLEALQHSEAQLDNSKSNNSLHEQATQTSTLAVSQNTPSRVALSNILEEAGDSPVCEHWVQQRSLYPYQGTEEKSYTPCSTSSPAFVKPLVITSNPVELQAQVVPLPQVKGTAAAAKFSSAHTFMGYAQPRSSVELSPVESSPTPTTEVQELDSQLQTIMERITSLQKTLRSHPQELTSAVQGSNKRSHSFLVVSEN